MAYSIQGVYDSGGEQKNFFVKDKKIAYVSKAKRRFKSMKVDCRGFVISPGQVGADFSMMEMGDPESFQNRCMKWQGRGCTTVLVVCDVPYEKQLPWQLKKARRHMAKSSLDYVLGVSFPMRHLTSSFVRACKREQVPFIMASLNHESDMDAVAWPWIRNEMFPYHPVIVPDFRRRKDFEQGGDPLWAQWQQLAASYELSTLARPVRDGEILSIQSLRKIGISPLKGELLIGADIDYNLYREGPLADSSSFHYDKPQGPDIVVERGKVMKAGSDVFFHPGFGKEISIRVPGHFTTY